MNTHLQPSTARLRRFFLIIREPVGDGERFVIRVKFWRPGSGYDKRVRMYAVCTTLGEARDKIPKTCYKVSLHETEGPEVVEMYAMRGG